MRFKQLLINPLTALQGRPGWNRLWLLLALMFTLELVAALGLTARLTELHDEVLQLHALREGARPARHTVLVVIDEQEHRERYGQRSPLNPALVARTLDQIALARPRALVVDLDLSPLDEADATLRRSHTDRALIQIGTRLPIVVACPQRASAPTGMTPTESRWVAALHGRGVGVGRVDLDDRGLYAPAVPDSLAPILVKRLKDPRLDADSAGHCMRAPPSDYPKSTLVPRTLIQVRAQDLDHEATKALLEDRIVVFGGTYGPADTFQFRGSPSAVYGVTLHAWQIETELLRESSLKPPEALAFPARLAIAWAYATALAWAWRQIADPRLSAHGRWFAYLITAGLVIAGPILTLSLAWQMPDLGQALNLSSLFVGILVSAVIAAPLLVDLRTRQAGSHAADEPAHQDTDSARKAFSLYRWVDEPWRGRVHWFVDQATLIGTRWMVVMAAAAEVWTHLGAIAAIMLAAGLLVAGARRVPPDTGGSGTA